MSAHTGFVELEDSFRVMFDQAKHTGTATEHPFAIHQGSHSVANYTVDF